MGRLWLEKEVVGFGCCSRVPLNLPSPYKYLKCFPELKKLEQRRCRECQSWDEVLSGEVVEFEKHAAGMAETGVCSCERNAKGG